MVLVDYIGIFLHVAILLATYCNNFSADEPSFRHTRHRIPYL